MKRLKVLIVCLLSLCTLQAQSILKINGEKVEKDFSYITLDPTIPGNILVYFTDNSSESYNMNLVEVYPNGVNEVIPGDANGDKKVNVTDIVATVNYILGKDDPTFIIEAADVNGDKVVNVTDIVMMVNIILTSGSRINQQELYAVMKKYGYTVISGN